MSNDAARKAAEAIDKMVAIWLAKMNLPTTNKEGREIFIQTVEDIISAHCFPVAALLEYTPEQILIPCCPKCASLCFIVDYSTGFCQRVVCKYKGAASEFFQPAQPEKDI